MAWKVMFEHTLVKNHIAARSLTALSLSRHLETYKNTQEHTLVRYVYTVYCLSQWIAYTIVIIQ